MKYRKDDESLIMLLYFLQDNCRPFVASPWLASYAMLSILAKFRRMPLKFHMKGSHKYQEIVIFFKRKKLVKSKENYGN